MAAIYTNNAATTLSGDITSVATSIGVVAGSSFPSPTGGDYFYATLEDGSHNIEIVKVTARSGNTLTVVRAQDGTTAKAYSSGDRLELRVTAAGLNEFLNLNDNLSDLADVSTARSNLGLGTAALEDIGTSGGTVPLLNTNNTWSGDQLLASDEYFYFGGTSPSGGIRIVHQTGNTRTLIQPYQTGAWSSTKRIIYSHGTAQWDIEGTPTINTNQIWHAGNDGPGSTLDADTLDGLQASAFGTLSGTNTWTNAQIIQSTAPIFDLKETDASADNGFWRTIVNAERLFHRVYTDAGSSFNSYITVSRSGDTVTEVQLDATTLDFNGAMELDTTPTVSGSQMWHAGNDGPGSGLDADTLDGIDSASFLRSDQSDTLSGGSLTIQTTGTGMLNLRRTSDTQFAGITFQQSSGTGVWLFYRVNDNDGDLILQRRNDAGSVLGSTFRAYRNSSVFDILTNSFTHNSNTVWDASTDGPGSGLDADTLDGVQLSDIAYNGGTRTSNFTYLVNDADYIIGDSTDGTQYFIWRDHSIGTLYLGTNDAAVVIRGPDIETFAGGVYWNADNDGPASGLDADTLDGNQASAFGLLAGTNTWTGNQLVSSNSGVVGGVRLVSGQTTRTGYIEFQAPTAWGETNNRAGFIGYALEDGVINMNSTTADYYYSFSYAPRVGSQAVWYPGNDGSGSGLDADTLDGVDSTSFLRSDETDVKTSGTLRFNDSVFLTLGSSNDWELFHNGSHNYMDLNVGNLYIRDNTTTRFTFARTTGDFTATGDLNAVDVNISSDERGKDNIETLPVGKVIQMRGVGFDRKQTGKRSAGVIAQELEEVAPELVSEDVDGFKRVNYSGLLGYMIEEIKDLRREMAELKRAA